MTISHSKENFTGGKGGESNVVIGIVPLGRICSERARRDIATFNIAQTGENLESRSEVGISG